MFTNGEQAKGCDDMNTEWENQPMYLGYHEIVDMGFSRATVYRWFNSDDFPPVIKRNGLKVNKYKFKDWLEGQEMRKNEVY